jgi:hypothetical protein
MFYVDGITSENLPDLLGGMKVQYKKRFNKGGAKPYHRLANLFDEGEGRAFLYEGRLGYHAEKVQGPIIHPDGKQMLKETRTFATGTVIPPSEKVSGSEKIKFVKGENWLEAFKRMCKEELSLILADPDLATLLYYGREDGRIVESVSFPGLLAYTPKHRFAWRMPQRHVRLDYQEVCSYRTSDFAWGPMSKTLRRALKNEKPVSAAA